MSEFLTINQQKIDKIQAWKVSCLVLPNVPGSSQDRPRVPQDGKVEAQSMPNDTHAHHNPPKIYKHVMLPRVLKSAQGPQDARVEPPIMPNDRFASQKYQDPLATMPRICNLKQS